VETGVVLGIDPGIASTGYGVIRVCSDDSIELIDCGVISTNPETNHELRLKKIYDAITEIIEKFRPQAVAVETVFYSRNIKSLVLVSEAIGVISLAAGNFSLPLRKFTPLEVKTGIARFGRAGKSQVQAMVKNLLKLDKIHFPDHAADALAVAICYRNLFC